MSESLTRYWIRFDWESLRGPDGNIAIADTAMFDLMGGVGVTARDADDASELIRERVHVEALMPIGEVIEAVDVASLGVASPMGDPNVRGIWYPVR